MGLAAVAAIATGASLAMQAVQGAEQGSAQRKSLRLQGEAQASATAQAQRTAEQNNRMMADANKQQPDLAKILARARAAMNSQPATLLTGPQGASPTLLGM